MEVPEEAAQGAEARPRWRHRPDQGRLPEGSAPRGRSPWSTPKASGIIPAPSRAGTDHPGTPRRRATGGGIPALYPARPAGVKRPVSAPDSPKRSTIDVHHRRTHHGNTTVARPGSVARHDNCATDRRASRQRNRVVLRHQTTSVGDASQSCWPILAESGSAHCRSMPAARSPESFLNAMSSTSWPRTARRCWTRPWAR
jgi:hypothetical protein